MGFDAIRGITASAIFRVLFGRFLQIVEKLKAETSDIFNGNPEALLNHQVIGLGIPKGRLVLWFFRACTSVDHRGSFSDVPLTPKGPGFVDYVLSIVNADHVVRVIQPPSDDF